MRKIKIIHAEDTIFMNCGMRLQNPRPFDFVRRMWPQSPHLSPHLFPLLFLQASLSMTKK
jgi:hypothetical protein